MQGVRTRPGFAVEYQQISVEAGGAGFHAEFDRQPGSRTGFQCDRFTSGCLVATLSCHPLTAPT